MIAISSGIIKGLQLKSPQGDQTRPSSERLRQGTFNILRHFRWQDSTIVDDAVVTDLFAGSGAWGIEALSNGAAMLQCVEFHRLAMQCLRQNTSIALQALKSQQVEPSIDVISKSVEIAYPLLQPTRVMFADPPYDSGWFSKVMVLEKAHHKIVDGGVLLYEVRKNEGISNDAAAANLVLFNEKNYGDSTVYFFVKRAPS